MGGYSSGWGALKPVILVLIGLSAVARAPAAHAEDVDAAPVRQEPPAFPEACRPGPDDDFTEQTVIVAYDVSRRGLPENVRVRETSDPCFDDTAVAAVRSWVFEPRRVDGKARQQQDLETTFKFAVDAEITLETFDARPIKRVPPEFPNWCGGFTRAEYRVVVEFDVTEEGRTSNIEVIESTRSCFEAAAVKSVRKWRYRPKYVDGKPVARPGVVTQIVFVSAGARSRPDPEDRMRNIVVRKLNKAGNRIKKDPAAALAMLEDIEAEYGASFTQAESAAFHQIRGFARIAANDPRGALDDLRIAKKRQKTVDENEAVEDAIMKLELYLAQEPIRDAAKEDSSAGSPPEAADEN